MQSEDDRRMVAAAERRPAHYPDDLPFVPRRPVELHTGTQESQLTWYGVERPFDLLQQLIGSSAREGWTRAAHEATGVARSVRFTRGTLERRIDVVQAGPFSSVVLRQRGEP